MNTEPGKLIGAKLSFEMTHASICGTIMATFVLDALSNNIVAEHPELWSGMQFRIMDNPICYELKAIPIATGTFMKWDSPKSFSFFKVSLE